MTAGPREDAVHSGNAVAIARSLVAIGSVNPDLESDGAGEAKIAAFCAELLESWGFDVSSREAVPGRPNVVARRNGTGPTLLLNGHLDTVGVAGMTIDPFGAELKDGRLWGRGSCDMKGGVAALLAAARALVDAPASERPGLVVALTADEENASVGMARLVEDDVAADLAVVCEPTELAVMPAHKGFVWIRTLFKGRAAHGSRPELGIDAIRHAALYLAVLEEHAAALRSGPAHPLLGHGSFHAGTIRGGAGASVYPESCELVLERRTLPAESVPDVVAPFREALQALVSGHPEIVADLTVTLDRPGTEVGEDTPLVQGLLAALAEVGVPPEVRGMSAWVDAAYLNGAGIPAVCFGPGSIEQAHTTDEWIDVEEIRVAADVLGRFARALVTNSNGR
ncbi:MAG: M20/M25/M40 family metallo-hydrolase [Gemmatimonadota bacterium]